MKRSHLAIFLGSATVPTVDRPTLRDHLYGPGPLDDAPTACGNCSHFMSTISACELHGPGVLVSPSMFCGYHVEGLPIPASAGRFRDDVRFVTPEQSNLRDASGRLGAACAACEHFEPLASDLGECRIAEGENGERSMVAARGHCVRWTMLG
jgi:hypothetical protein